MSKIRRNYNRSYSSKDIDRFYSKVKAVKSGCLEWQGATVRARYGRFIMGSNWLMAHRVAYVMRYGYVDPKYDIHHTCGNRRCVNTHHLRALYHVEHRPNSDKTHCPRGHPYNSENTYIYRGRRYCKACRLGRARNDG